MPSPYQILGVAPSASLSDIKKAYHTLSKLYHPDKNSSKDALEKFKAINNAYNTLKDYHGEHASYRYRSSSTSGYSRRHQTHTYDSRDTNANSQNTTGKENSSYHSEEEKLYEEIFGRSYNSDPMFFYSKDNLHLRKKYEEQLKKMRSNEKQREESKAGEHFRGSHHHYRDYNEHHSSHESEYKRFDDPLIWTVAIGASMGFLFLFYLTKREEGTIITLEKQKEMELMVERFREIELKKSKDKLERSKENYVRSMPRMKKYSIENEPDAESLLVEYTVYPDIKIYSVPHHCFYTDLEHITQTNSFEKTKIRNLKVNTAISLSLEAERLLKNTFVYVSQLKKSIETKGFYEPPGIFTRFFGFVYFKLRKMPILIENIKPNTEWISLFDLYMRHHSPLPYVHEDFFEFKVNSSKSSWLGNVTLNHRKIEKVYLKGDEENVFFWKGNNPMSYPESRYVSVWDNFHITSRDSYK